MLRISPLVLAACLLAAPVAADASDDVRVTLKGSRESMLRQNRIAKEEQYAFLRTPTDVRSSVSNGALVDLPGNEDYAVIAGYPYARPVVRAFVELLSSRYREACGERLVVTSLTRPSSRQPRNASPLSVHPAGMAVDLRVSRDRGCVDWISSELLELEQMGLIDATLERNPPHFHVAVFPSPFTDYEQSIRAEEDAAEAERLLEEAVAARDAGLEPQTAEADADAGQSAAPRMLLRVATLIAQLFLPV